MTMETFSSESSKAEKPIERSSAIWSAITLRTGEIKKTLLWYGAVFTFAIFSFANRNNLKIKLFP